MTTEQSLLASIFSQLSSNIAEREDCRLLITVTLSCVTKAQAIAVALRALNPSANINRSGSQLQIDSLHWTNSPQLAEDIEFLWASPDVTSASVRRISSDRILGRVG